MFKFDLKNKKIIAELLTNCRISNTQLAKKVELSREVVAYRIKKLEEEQIIKEYTADINFNNIGFQAHSIGIKFHQLSQEKEKRLLNEISNNTLIAYAQKTIGIYDLVLTTLTKKTSELEQLTQTIRNIIEKHIKTIDIDLFLGDIDFSTSLFINKKTPKEISFIQTKENNIDINDKKILKELVKNSKQTTIEMANKTQLNVFTISNKMKQLQKKEVLITCKTIIDFEKLGLHRYTILINFYNQKKESKLIEYCRKNKDIWDIGKYIGNYNYVIEIMTKDNKTFKEVTQRLLQEFSEEIIDYNSIIVTEEIKHKYFPN